MYYSAKRQQYLVDQGYTFKVIQDLVDIANAESTLLRTKEQECDLLARVKRKNTDQMDAAEEKAIKRNVEEEYDSVNQLKSERGPEGTNSVLLVGKGKGIVANLSRPGTHVVLGGGDSVKKGRLAGVKRKVSSLKNVSGVDGATYEEFDAPSKR